MGAFLNFVLMVTWALTSLTSGQSHVTSSSWRRLVDQDAVVSGYEVWVRRRSKVECIRECNKYSHCTSFVFNVSSRTCYLQPALDNTTHTAHLGQVYVNTDPTCTEQKAPAINGSLVWSRTLTSLIATVTCFKDFINTTSDVILSCGADGTWETVGDCVQHIWHNPPPSLFPVALPLPVVSGWSVCMEGVVHVLNKFNMDLMVDKQNRPMHTSFRFSQGQVNIMRQVGGAFIDGTAHSPIPISLAQPFHLRIRAPDTGVYELYIDHVLVTTYPQVASMPPTNLAFVTILFDVEVTLLDLWCWQ